MAALPARSADADWALYVSRHVHAEGRVVDDGQGGISHSEGQGVSMFLAVHFGDRNVFDQLWRWTKTNLRTRNDALLAWKWSETQGVTDRNNATDGDIMVAWALLRAAERWGDTSYRKEAIEITETILKKLVRDTNRGPVLLPGNEGFVSSEGNQLNLSYWIFPALLEFERASPGQGWSEISIAGHKLLKEARFGRWGLPPDWLSAGKNLELPSTLPPRFGYDAVRIPLYLLWAKAEPEELQSFRNFWEYFRGASFMPAWTNLKDDSVGSYDAIGGIRAISAAARAYPDMKNVQLPPFERSQPYYSASLLLLTKVMLCERTGC